MDACDGLARRLSAGRESDARNQRYRSGKSGGRAIALKQDQEVEIPENLLTTLMSEQARESMSRHSKDLHSEAARWRDMIRAFHKGDREFDYLFTDLRILESRSDDWLITTLFYAHLKEDQPSTFGNFERWLKEARDFKERAVNLLHGWKEDVACRLEEEKNLLAGGYDADPITHFKFALMVWRGILSDYSFGGSPGLGFLSQEEWVGPVYELRNQGDSCFLWYFNEVIASGTEQWVKRAKDMIHLVYKDQQFLLPEEIQRSSLFEEQRRIIDLAKDAAHGLDMICRGGVVFKPGNCEFCAHLLF